ncbi:MAG: tRNA pseudouridine(55) synthase TruB [Pseudomonadota bacterium]|nr:tRNA pseudouridine(55) synthase TruB [Pseudomonadota bacterium]MDP1905164.1 tRNA pseudouridine(55) synthase TruB [Pseudomonadota bacterium]MDP2351921.1 tRNA pseudouridine(55) synthase TruB [Pseudomonadota bacterium]
MNKIVRRAISGVLLLDKVAGFTSNAALQKAKWLYRAEKAGHTGTLDPFATGLLPLCLGEATKFSQFLLDADKVYRAEILFGIRTSSGDLDGEVIAERPVTSDEANLRQALERFRGDIEQVPPMHSALKHQGRPLYEYARQGIEIERAARKVTVFDIELESFDGRVASVRVHSSKGFYVRALADDLGEVLGCGAHLTGLDRLQVGPYHLEDAITLEELAELSEEERDARLLPPDNLTLDLARLDLDLEAAWQINHGQAIWQSGLRVGELLRLYAPDGTFLGVAEVNQDGKAAPKRLLASS